MVFEIGIGTSQNWDPEKASLEATTDALSKLTHPPTFVLLFSTIHYEKNNGFQKILDTTYTKIPKETPLVGGTVAGFMNNNGCYTRGMTILTCYSDEIEPNIDFASNIKINPQTASNKLNFQDNENSIIITNIANGTVPNLPFLGRKRIIRAPLPDKILLKSVELLSLFGYGVGREPEFEKNLAQRLPNTSQLIVANYDDNNSLSNYQFHKKAVLKNSASCLQLKFKNNFSMNSEFGAIETGKKFTISDEGVYGCAFSKANKNNALDELWDLLGWDKSSLTEQIYRRTYYYPIGYKIDDKKYSLHIMGLVINNSICTTHKFDKKENEFFVTSGKKIIESVKNMTDQNEKNNFIFGNFCTSHLETLGKKIFQINELIKENHLIVFSAGEGYKYKKEEPYFFNSSFTFFKF
ncbi:MAG: hypothetical protein WC308_01550 [archaeon]|jgi:hypothetical protein